MQNYLVVSAVTENSSEIIGKLSKLSKTSGCSIVDSRIKVIGNEVSLMLFLSGTWDAIAKIEDMLKKLEQEKQILILSKRTELKEVNADAMPYAIDVVGQDQPGVIFDITDFMAKNNLQIQEMSSNTYQASQTGAKMFSLHMLITIPLDTSIAAVRGDFIDFCDQLNLDAIMEPTK